MLLRRLAVAVTLALTVTAAAALAACSPAPPVCEQIKVTPELQTAVLNAVQHNLSDADKSTLASSAKKLQEATQDKDVKAKPDLVKQLNDVAAVLTGLMSGTALNDQQINDLNTKFSALGQKAGELCPAS